MDYLVYRLISRVLSFVYVHWPDQTCGSDKKSRKLSRLEFDMTDQKLKPRESLDCLLIYYGKDLHVDIDRYSI